MSRHAKFVECVILQLTMSMKVPVYKEGLRLEYYYCGYVEQPNQIILNKQRRSTECVPKIIPYKEVECHRYLYTFNRDGVSRYVMNSICCKDRKWKVHHCVIIKIY